MTVRNYILNKIVQYPHIAVRIKFYPERLFGNINIVIYLLIFKYGYDRLCKTHCDIFRCSLQ